MHPRTEVIQSGKIRNLDVTEGLTYQGTPFVPSAVTDEKAKVSSNDTTPGYLNGKLVAGTNITLTENNNGGDETLTISAAGGGGGLTGFTGSQNSTGVNISVNASQLLADAASVNADIVLQPKGYGAVLAQLPDGTATGGNKRNSYCVDLQTTRLNAADVASGGYSVIVGGNSNRSSGSYASILGGSGNQAQNTHSVIVAGLNNISNNNYAVIVGGQASTASGQHSFIGGGQSNTTSGSHAVVGGGHTNSATANYTFIGGGYANSATSYAAIVVGGDSNSASGTRSSIIGARGTNVSGQDSGAYNASYSSVTNSYSAVIAGESNTLGGSRSIIAGGDSNSSSAGYTAIIAGVNNSIPSGSAVVSGVFCGEWNTISNPDSVVVAGSRNTIDKDGTFCIGKFAKSNSQQSIIFGGGRFSGLNTARGEFQQEIVKPYIITTNATPTELTLDGSTPSGSSNRIFIANDSTVSFEAMFTARRSDADNESAGYIIRGVIDNNANTVAFAGTPTVTVLNEDIAAWDLTVSADNTNKCLVFTATGEAGKTIRWGGFVTLVVVSG
jgi:hypothetical protein